MTKSWARKSVETTLAGSGKWAAKGLGIRGDEEYKDTIEQWYGEKKIKNDPAEDWYILTFRSESQLNELDAIMEKATSRPFEENVFWINDFAVAVRGSAIDAARELLFPDSKQRSP